MAEKGPDQEFQQNILERLARIESEIARIQASISAEQVKPQEIPKPKVPLLKRPVKPSVPSSTPAQKTGKIDLESSIGTKWIGRVGMVALVFGIAFFLKYSFDNKFIGETGRIILGIIGGSALIGIGEYFQKKKYWRIYGQIFTGGGLAVLYFSIYAAFAFYHLIPQLLAFAAMIVITSAGITLSLRYSALSTAAIGILGGFLTPIMLSTGENRPVSLFSYILLLDIGTLLTAYFRGWRSISVASVVGTIIIYSAWHEKFYSLDQRALAFGITTVFFLLFNSYAVISGAREKRRSIFGQAVIYALAGFYLSSFFFQNNDVNNWDLKSFVLALTAFELLLAYTALKTKPDDRGSFYAFWGASVILTIISIPVVFEKEWLSAALSAEMAVLAYTGIKLERPHVRFASYILGVFCIARFMSELNPVLGPFESLTIFLNFRFLSCGMIIAAFYAMLFVLYRGRERLTPPEAIVPAALLVITQFLSVVLLSKEFSDFYSSGSLDFLKSHYAELLSLSIVWAVYASGMVAVGIIKKSRLLRVLGILLFAITVGKVFLFDLSELETFYRIISFIILGLLLLTVSYFYNRYKMLIFGEDRHA